MKRAVLARETPIELVKECAEEGLDLEIFVYGALCVCYSGECLMSSINGGPRRQPRPVRAACRLPYRLVEISSGREIQAPGEYLLSPMDLNTLDHVEELIQSGATSFKIEGRMKRPEYVGAVVRAYRERKIDAVLAGMRPQYAGKREYPVKEAVQPRLHRGLSVSSARTGADESGAAQPRRHSDRHGAESAPWPRFGEAERAAASGRRVTDFTRIRRRRRLHRQLHL